MGAALKVVLYLGRVLGNHARGSSSRVSFPLSAIYKILGSVCRACVTVTARLASTHTALVSSPQKPGCSSLSIFTLL